MVYNRMEEIGNMSKQKLWIKGNWRTTESTELRCIECGRAWGSIYNKEDNCSLCNKGVTLRKRCSYYYQTLAICPRGAVMIGIEEVL